MPRAYRPVLGQACGVGGSWQIGVKCFECGKHKNRVAAGAPFNRNSPAFSRPTADRTTAAQKWASR